MDWKFIIFSLVKIGIVVGVVQGLVAYSVLAERKISAWIQDRVGPNRTEYATSPCTTPTTIAIFTKLKMINFQSIFILLPQRHRGTEKNLFQMLFQMHRQISFSFFVSSLCLCVSVANQN